MKLEATDEESKIALDVFRGRWKADVLYRLCAGAAGFGELQRQLPGVTRTMLASTLCDLERDGVVSRREFADGKVKRTEYTLTDNGKDLYPVFYALQRAFSGAIQAAILPSVWSASFVSSSFSTSPTSVAPASFAAFAIVSAATQKE